MSRGLIFSTLVVSFVLTIDFLSQGSIRALVRAGGVRMWSASSQAASAIAGSGITQSRRTLVEENEALKQEVTRLELRVATLKSFEDENARLRAIVRLAQELPGITAPIVSSFRASPYGTFIVGAGIEDGVGVGDLVIATGEGGSRVVIGRVSEVSEHLSFAVQIFAPDVLTEAIIGGASLTIEGRGGGNARAEVPRALPVEAGDVVTSPSFRGMSIGIVGGVSDDPSGTHKVVYIGLPVNFSTLKFVYVAPYSK